MRKTVIFGNGELRNIERHRHHLGSLDSLDHVICADGGVRNALRLGVAVDTVIGDLDSLSRRLYSRIEKKATFHIYPRRKDQSDLEMALNYALLSKPSSILIMGALGKRLDHTLTNVALLEKCLRHDIPCSIVGDREELRMLDRSLTITGVPGQVVSLLAVSPEVTGVRLTGFAYPLQGETLYRGQSRGQSNELIFPEASITVESGLLLAVINEKDL